MVEYNTFVEFGPDRPLTVDDYRWHHTENLLQIRSCKVVDGAAAVPAIAEEVCDVVSR